MIPIFDKDRRNFLGVFLSGLIAALSRFAGAQTSQKLMPHRRVVTGVNAVGKSVISVDGPVPAEGTWSTPKTDGADLWFLKQVPFDLSDATDPIEGYKGSEFPSSDSVITRIVRWQPGFQINMHRSATIDFVFIISGHIELLLEDGSTILGSGDCVVQRGTVHGWRVVGDEVFVGGVVIVGAK